MMCAAAQDSDDENSSSEDDSDEEPVPSFAELVGRKPAAAGPPCTCDLDPCLCAAGGRAFKAKRDDQQVVTPARDGLKLDDDTRLDAALSDRLRPHQRRGIRFLYDRVVKDGKGCVLADHMGLGKTLQLIGTLQSWFANRRERTALVVAPAFVLPNWLDEVEKWLPKDRSIRMRPLPKGDRAPTIKKWAREGGCLLVGYEMFRLIVSQNDDLAKLVLGTGLVVLDEAHRLKEPKSQIYKALTKITTRRRILATGYPIQNRLDEYYALVDYARPNILGDDDLFKRFFEGPIVAYLDGGKNRGEALRRAHALRNALEDVVLRRGADTLGDDLPRRRDWVVECALTEVQRKLYDAFVESGAAESTNSRGELAAYHTALAICNHPDIIDKHLSEEERLFSADTRSEEVVTGDAWAAPEVVAREASRAAARQLRDESKRDQHRVKARKKNGLDDAEAFCGSLRAWAAPVLTDHAAGSTRASGKAQVCLALLAEVKRRGERCVVFTQTLGTLDVLEDLLASTDIAWCRIDGSTPAAARSEIVHAFNARKEQGKRIKRDAVDALLVSIRAGGEGVNMTGACRVVLYDVCWNPCFDRQAMCRAHRLGQKREVNVYRLVAPAGTMEARVFQLQRRKELLVREVIQQRGVSVEAARLIVADGDEILQTVVAAHAAAVASVREDPLETAPPVSTKKLLTEPEKRLAVDEWAAARASH